VTSDSGSAELRVASQQDGQEAAASEGELTMTTTHGALVVLLAGFVSACGASAAATAPTTRSAQPTSDTTATPAAAAPVAIDPCKLVTKADAEALARLGLNDGQEYGAEPVTCTYNAPPTGPTAQVSVGIKGAAKNFLDVERGLGAQFSAIPGVAADEAWYEQGHDNVFSRKGSVWVSIALVRLNDPAENRAPLEQLARTAASRM
jgi:hypothetical protein